jgi:hypothetical protein
VDQVTISKDEDVAEPTYQQGSNPTGPTELSVQILSNKMLKVEAYSIFFKSFDDILESIGIEMNFETIS